MGAAESQHDNGLQRDSGGISDLISLDNLPWWGEGLSKESGQQKEPGGKAEKSVMQALAEPGHYFGEQHDLVSGRKKTEHYFVDHQEVVRPRTLQFDEAPHEKKFEDELQSEIGSGSQNGSEQYYEEEEDEVAAPIPYMAQSYFFNHHLLTDSSHDSLYAMVFVCNGVCTQASYGMCQYVDTILQNDLFSTT